MSELMFFRIVRANGTVEEMESVPGKYDKAANRVTYEFPQPVKLDNGDIIQCSTTCLSWNDFGSELAEAIPIITDGRFDSESAIEHLRYWKRNQ